MRIWWHSSRKRENSWVQTLTGRQQVRLDPVGPCCAVKHHRLHIFFGMHTHVMCKSQVRPAGAVVPPAQAWPFAVERRKDSQLSGCMSRSRPQAFCFPLYIWSCDACFTCWACLHLQN